MEMIKNLVYGMMMGVANVIPGVSGGTIAVIFDFYDRLLESITLDFKVIKKNLSFLIPLGIGVLVGIVGISKVMKYLLENFPLQTYLGFIGVIIGSLPLIYFKAQETGKMKKEGVIVFVIALAIMLALSFTSADKEAAKEFVRYTSLNFESFFVCFFAMGIATVTMLIPGVSGSLLLIIMGMYGTIYGYAVAEMNIPLLIPIGLGAIVSLLVGAKLVRFLLAKYRQATYMTIFGLLLGSIIQLIVISGVSLEFSFELISAVAVACVLAGLTYWSSIKEIQRSR